MCPLPIYILGSLGTCTLISVVAPLYSLPQLNHAMASHPSPCDKAGAKEHWNQAKIAEWNSMIYVCTRVPEFFLLSSFSCQRPASHHPSNLTLLPWPTPYPPSTYFHQQHNSSDTVLSHSLDVSKPPQYTLIHSIQQLLFYSSSYMHLIIHD